MSSEFRAHASTGVWRLTRYGLASVAAAGAWYGEHELLHRFMPNLEGTPVEAVVPIIAFLIGRWLGAWPGAWLADRVDRL